MSALPCEQAHSISKDIAAPCTGILVPTNEARDCIRAKSIELPMCLSEVDHCIDSLQLEKSTCTETSDALKRHALELEGLLVDALEPRPWYEDPILAFTVGALTASAVAVTLALAR